MKVKLVVITLSAAIILCSYTHAQPLAGRVVDKTTSRPMPGASVFINNSSLGAITNSAGEFLLTKRPHEAVELIISYAEYQTKIIRITPADTFLLISLEPKIAENENVTVHSYEKNGWEHWGFLFGKLFLGNTSFADHSKIENPKDIRFSFSEKEQVLRATARKTLIITNKALGYRLEYDMQEFRYELNTKRLMFSGYPFFTELNGSAGKKKRWNKNRLDSYEGSPFHFVRALAQSRCAAEGFVMRHLKVLPNLEKQRVALILQSTSAQAIAADSMRYYRSKLKEGDGLSILDSNPIAEQQIVHAGRDENSKQLFFPDNLYVTYPAKKEATDYFARNNNVAYDSCITGIVHLEENEPLTIFPSGNYYEVTNMYISGYWSWQANVASLLPIDYMPGEKRN